jgi:phage terminase large subunit
MSQPREIFYTKIFERTKASKAFVVINVGGARSSKSYSIAQVLIEKLITERGKKIGICRKTFPSLRMSTMLPFIDMLKEYGLYREEGHNKTFNSYVYGTNFIQFFSLDESEKIKSTEFNYIWMEEANEFSYEDYINLKLRLSGAKFTGEQNHLYLSLNPIDSMGWIPERAIKEQDVEVIKSNYMDNPFLSSEYMKNLTDLLQQDEAYYRVYVLGEWGKLEGKIFTNYKIIPALPVMTSAKWAYGLDFGLINPSAITKAYLLDDKFYLEEKLYKEGLTNKDIIERFTHEERGDIFGDPSSKMMIEEIRRAGFSAYEGHRGVKESIDLMQRQTLHIPENSVHLIREIQGYCWKKDKRDVEKFLPEPIKVNDHALDAARYAIWGITERYGFATRRPRTNTKIETLHFSKPSAKRFPIRSR